MDDNSVIIDWDALINAELSVLTNIPQTNRFLGSKIFVRECYPLYYDMVLELLQDYRMVSVTGTPGIGKSVFGLYFFHRYRRTNPTHKLLMASFTAQTKLSQCCLYPALNDGQTAPPKDFTVIPRDVCDLYLYDGPPDDKPPGDSKMVAFVSPHPVWLDKIASKYPDHAEIYMPNWSFNEQQTAIDVLGLNVSTEELRRRNELFGGTARYTLTNNSRYVNRAIQNVYEALGKIKTLDQIQDIFNNESSIIPISHKIMHYFPCADGSMATFKPASLYIAQEMEKNVRLEIKKARAKLQLMLESASKASVFCGWVFECSVHNKLLQGGVFTLKNLRTNNELPLVVDETQGYYKRFKTDRPLEEVLQTYAIPESSTFEAVDSYLFDGSTLWLFQITLNVNHGVKLQGLLEVVEYLSLRQAIQDDPSMVKLIFVVPPSAAQNFRVQKIVADHIFTAPHATLDTIDCNQVSGIGVEKKRKLQDIGINTVEDLLRARPEDVSFVKARVEKLRKNLAVRDEALIWSQRIDQFIFEFDYMAHTA